MPQQGYQRVGRPTSHSYETRAAGAAAAAATAVAAATATAFRTALLLRASHCNGAAGLGGAQAAAPQVLLGAAGVVAGTLLQRPKRPLLLRTLQAAARACSRQPAALVRHMRPACGAAIQPLPQAALLLLLLRILSCSLLLLAHIWHELSQHC